MILDVIISKCIYLVARFVRNNKHDNNGKSLRIKILNIFRVIREPKGLGCL